MAICAQADLLCPSMADCGYDSLPSDSDDRLPSPPLSVPAASIGAGVHHKGYFLRHVDAGDQTPEYERCYESLESEAEDDNEAVLAASSGSPRSKTLATPIDDLPPSDTCKLIPSSQKVCFPPQHGVPSAQHLVSGLEFCEIELDQATNTLPDHAQALIRTMHCEDPWKTFPDTNNGNAWKYLLDHRLTPSKVLRGATLKAEAAIAGSKDCYRVLKDRQIECAAITCIFIELFMASHFAKVTRLIRSGVKKAVLLLRAGQSDEAMNKLRVWPKAEQEAFFATPGPPLELEERPEKRRKVKAIIAPARGV